jgi:hypothetical protein
MKQVCDGCVWIQPSISKSSESQNSKIADSFVVSHVSDVAVCSGIRSLEINSAFDTNVPQRIPQVSKLRCVLAATADRNWVRRFAGRKTERRGLPFSKYADGLNV